MKNGDNPFEYHESDLYVACVGENGAYEDTMIYPVVYNVRHSIELSMKIVIEYLLHIYDFRKVSFGQKDKKKIYTHDIETLDAIIQKYYLFDHSN